MSGELVPAGSGGALVVPATAGELAAVDQGAGHGGAAVARTDPARSITAAPAVTAAPAAALGNVLGRVATDVARELGIDPRRLFRVWETWEKRNQPALEEAQEELAIAQQLAEDKEHAAECESELRAEWGAEYSTNIARIKGWLNAQPEDFSEAILQARYFGGHAICADAAFLRAALQLATTNASAPGRSEVDVDKRIEEIQALMADTSSEYWRGSRAEAIQAEYRELVDLQQQRSR